MTSAISRETLCGAGPVAAAIRLVRYPGSLRQPVHVHDHMTISLVLRGGLTETTHPRRAVTAGTFALVIKAAGVPHADHFSAHGCEILQVELPREFEPREFGISEDRVVWRSRVGPELRQFVRLWVAVRSASTGSATDVDLAVCDLLHALAQDPVAACRVPRWLARLKECIDDSSPASAWSLAGLAAVAGVHPVHMTRMFRRCYGSSIRDYLKFRRASAAAQYVAGSALPLTDVAHQLAYADQGHFCRAFRSIAGIAPGHYRRLLARSGRARG